MSQAPIDNDHPQDMVKDAAKVLATEAAQQLIAKGGEDNAAKSEKAPETVAKVQQGAQIAQQVLGVAQSLSKSSENSGNNGGVSNNTASSSATKQPTAAEVAASLLPVMVGYEVIIEGTKIEPVAAIAITQSHGSHHRLVVHFGHELVQEEGTFTIEDAQSLLGKPATVVIKNLNNADGPKLECKFVIADIELDQQDLEEGMLCLTGYSPTWLLDGAPHFESFTGKNLKEIATAVAKPLEQVNSKLNARPTLTTTLPFVCRYNESAWNFLKRLAGETGQWLYFNGKELVFGKPESEAPATLIYGQDCYHIQLTMRTAAVQTGFFDYHAAGDRIIGEKAQTPGADAGAYASAAFRQSKTMFAAPAHTAPAALGGEKSIVEAIGKARADSSAATLYVMKGESTLYHLRVGLLIDVTFKRKGQSVSHGQMRIVSISHHLSGDGHYSNTFEAIPAGAGAPSPVYRLPATHPMLAKVIDNKDAQGRVKVEFIGWQGDNSKQTDWLRVLTPDAGGGGDKVSKNRGLVTIPEVGDQVYVDFENGNPDKPFVTGSVFHGKHGSGGGDGNKTKSLTTRSGSTISLDDATGSLHATDANGNTMYMDGAGNILVKSSASIKLECGAAAIEMKEDGTISLSGKDIVLKGTATIKTSETPEVTIDGASAVKVTSAGKVDIVETPSISIKSDGVLKAQAITIDINGTAMTNVKGGVINLNG